MTDEPNISETPTWEATVARLRIEKAKRDEKTRQDKESLRAYHQEQRDKGRAAGRKAALTLTFHEVEISARAKPEDLRSDKQVRDRFHLLAPEDMLSEEEKFDSDSGDDIWSEAFAESMIETAKELLIQLN